MRYAVTVKGKVQDVGYRDIVEAHAKAIGLSGFVFNDEGDDGRVNLICEGTPDTIDEFINVIDVHEGRVSVDNIDKFEIESSFKLPKKFTRLQTDDLGDVGRKLDEGNTQLKVHSNLLKNISEGVDGLSEGVDGLSEGVDGLSEGQDKLVDGQDRLGKGQEKGFNSIVKILEKIHDKL
ncbi:MAG: hypothetical protein A7315_02295 [Candidatus Altiarchaeales archaeon WOR_SM1_79]|nr:MAG: hypothetical protein A7315_02295 [Candidatus Altiarchaeales archaeon WOR_SM1_79]